MAQKKWNISYSTLKTKKGSIVGLEGGIPKEVFSSNSQTHPEPALRVAR